MRNSSAFVSLRKVLHAPGFGYFASPCEVVDDEDQLVLMIAVQDLDVYAGVGHAAAEQAKLTGHILPQTLDQNVSLGHYLNAGPNERVARRGGIFDQKMSDAFSLHDPRATAFNADTGAAERFAHVGK